jgi:hypothetical protein
MENKEIKETETNPEGKTKKKERSPGLGSPAFILPRVFHMLLWSLFL